MEEEQEEEEELAKTKVDNALGLPLTLPGSEILLNVNIHFHTPAAHSRRPLGGHGEA